MAPDEVPELPFAQGWQGPACLLLRTRPSPDPAWRPTSHAGWGAGSGPRMWRPPVSKELHSVCLIRDNMEPLLGCARHTLLGEGVCTWTPATSLGMDLAGPTRSSEWPSQQELGYPQSNLKVSQCMEKFTPCFRVSGCFQESVLNRKGWRRRQNCVVCEKGHSCSLHFMRLRNNQSTQRLSHSLLG